MSMLKQTDAVPHALDRAAADRHLEAVCRIKIDAELCVGIGEDGGHADRRNRRGRAHSGSDLDAGADCTKTLSEVDTEFVAKRIHKYVRSAL